MKLSQKARLVILVLYTALLFCVCRFLFDAWFPRRAQKRGCGSMPHLHTFCSGHFSLVLSSQNLPTPYPTRSLRPLFSLRFTLSY